MKKIFEAPEMKISVFEDSNILTTASGGGVAAKNSFGYSNDDHTVHSDWNTMSDDVTVVP